jgi:hypothetical protein
MNSIECYLRCLYIRKTQDCPYLYISRIYRELGELHYYTADHKRSEEYISQYLRIYESIHPIDSQDLASVYEDLSDFYASVQENQRAHYYYQKSREALY